MTVIILGDCTPELEAEEGYILWLVREGRLCPNCYYELGEIVSYRGHTRNYCRAKFCHTHAKLFEMRTFLVSARKVKLRIETENRMLGGLQRVGNDYTEDYHGQDAKDHEQAVEDSVAVGVDTGQTGVGPDTDFKDPDYWKQQALKLRKLRILPPQNDPETGKAAVHGIELWGTAEQIRKALKYRDGLYSLGRHLSRSYCKWNVWECAGCGAKYDEPGSSYCPKEHDGLKLLSPAECGVFIPYVKGERRRTGYCPRHEEEHLRYVERTRQERHRVEEKRKQGVLYVAPKTRKRAKSPVTG